MVAQPPYAGDLAAYTASFAKVKLLLNAVVSEAVKFLTSDITDFYLGTPISSPEFMWIPLKYFSAKLITLYNLISIQHNGMVMMQLDKSIYGLPQAGILSQQRLVEQLSFHGYTECPNSSCLFRHNTRNTKFTLVVDDFLSSMTPKTMLSQIYTLRTDWSGSLYLGLSIAYSHGSHSLTISMPSNIPAALKLSM